MDPLKPLSQVLQALRSRRGAEVTQKTAVNTLSPNSTTNTASDNLHQLEHRLRVRLAGIPANDRGSAHRLFVETVLVNELGDHLAVDPGFQPLIERVVQAIANDKDVGPELDTFLKSLNVDT